MVAVANSCQLLDHVGLTGQGFWVSRAPRFAVRPGRGRAADGHTLSFQPLADYCPQFIDDIPRQGSEVLIPCKVTQQVVLAGWGLRGSQAPVPTCGCPSSRDAPFGSQKLPTVRETPPGGGMTDFGKERHQECVRSSTPGPWQGRPLPLRTAAASCVFSLPHKGTLLKPPSPQRPWVDRGAWCPGA